MKLGCICGIAIIGIGVHNDFGIPRALGYLRRLLDAPRGD
jgi:hypothetical protein